MKKKFPRPGFFRQTATGSTEFLKAKVRIAIIHQRDSECGSL